VVAACTCTTLCTAGGRARHSRLPLLLLLLLLLCARLLRLWPSIRQTHGGTQPLAGG
jgi:hypothetical protein